MKRIKSVSVLLLALCMVSPLFLSGCRKTANSTTDVEIVYWRSGLGGEWIEDVVNMFNESQSTYVAHLTSTTDGERFSNEIKRGAKYNSVDLYLTGCPNFYDYIEYVEPLNSLLKSSVEGESKTIGEKLDMAFMEDYDGTYYAIPYGGGWEGIVCNAAFIPQSTVINTTDDLEAVVIELAAQDITPFIHYSNSFGGYWNRVYTVWQAQYDSYNYYVNNFLTLTDEEGNSPSKEVLMREDGRKAVLDVLESIVSYNYVYSGSNSISFTTAQTNFINGAAAMMVNGSWMQNEMKSTDSEYKEFYTIRTPIISSIVETFEGADKNMSNSKLSGIITKIDNDVPYSESEYGCSEATYKRISDARNLMGANFTGHKMAIPNYAVGKEGAKEFIRFFCSDEIIEYYTNKLHIIRPIAYSDGKEYDTTGWSTFELSQLDFRGSTPVVEFYYKDSVLFKHGGASYYAKVNIVSKLSGRGTDYWDADTIWGNMMTTFDKNFDTYCLNAGIGK